MKKLTALMFCLLCTILCMAQKKVVLHYDFNKNKGVVVKDKSRNHADATLMNGARVENGCLVLDGGEAYLDMGTKAGEVMSQLDNFSIKVRYFLKDDAVIKGNGHFLWCFSVLDANKEKDGPYQAYRLNEQRCETSIGGWSQETGIQKSSVSEKGKWVTVLFTQRDGKGELYIDDVLVGTEQGFPNLSTIFNPAPRYNWMGRAPFSGDKFLEKVMIDDFCVWSE